MSEETKTEEKPKEITVNDLPVETRQQMTIKIEKNGKVFPFVPTMYIRGPKKKDGLAYPAPAKGWTLSDTVAFLGDDVSQDILMAKLKQFCQGWFERATDNGNPDSFREMALSMQFLRVSIGDLQEKLEKINELIQETAATADGEGNLTPENMKKLLGLIKEQKDINKQIDEKRRSKSKDEEDAE